MPQSRRAQTRYDVEIEVEITIAGETRPATLTNISLGGAYLGIGDPLKMGTRVDLSFRIPTLEERIHIGASVRWSDESGAGLQLDGLRAREVWSLNRYFDSLKNS